MTDAVEQQAAFSRECALIAAKAADEKKATDIMVQEVCDLIGVTDYFVIATAANSRQVDAIIDEIEDKLREDAGIKPTHREMSADGSWSLLDYGNIVVHVFMPETREYYRLEALWNDAPVIDLAAEAGLENLQYSDRIAKLLGREATQGELKAPREPDGRLGRRGSAQKGKRRKARSEKRDPSAMAEGSFLMPAPTAAVSRKCSRLTSAPTPMVSRERSRANRGETVAVSRFLAGDAPPGAARRAVGFLPVARGEGEGLSCGCGSTAPCLRGSRIVLELFRKQRETPSTGLPRAFLAFAGVFHRAACILRAACPGDDGRGSAALCSLLVARTVGAS